MTNPVPTREEASLSCAAEKAIRRYIMSLWTWPAMLFALAGFATSTMLDNAKDEVRHVEQEKARKATDESARLAKATLDKMLETYRQGLDSLEKRHDSIIESAYEARIKSESWLARISGDVKTSGLLLAAAQSQKDTLDKLSQAQSNEDFRSSLAETLAKSIDFRQRIAAGLELGTPPVGSIIALPFASADIADLGNSWMPCDGSADPLLIKEYEGLYNLLKKNNWDIEENADTFRIPNLVGRFLRGATDANDVGRLQEPSTGRPEKYAMESAGEHSHTTPAAQLTGSGSGHGGAEKSGPLKPQKANSTIAGSHSHMITWDDETRPRNAAVTWMMRVK